MQNLINKIVNDDLAKASLGRLAFDLFQNNSYSSNDRLTKELSNNPEVRYLIGRCMAVFSDDIASAIPKLSLPQNDDRITKLENNMETILDKLNEIKSK